jgi:hypothetical protein
MEQGVREMHSMIASYGHLAANRFVDAIPMLLRRHFLEALHPIIEEKLQCLDSDLKEIMEESSTSAYERERLKEKIERLSSVIRRYGDAFIKW